MNKRLSSCYKLPSQHAFGMQMPQRTYTVGGASIYRYGFNGKENDNEVKGSGNQLDFGARIYDPRLGRFLSTDAYKKMAPDWSPYRFGFDNPLRYKDGDGNWEEDGHFWTVYAMGVAMGMSKQTARLIAVHAEYYDHQVHSDNSLHITPIPGKAVLSWGSDGGAGTWADPYLQGDYHGLTAGPQSEVLTDAVTRVIAGELYQLHKVGDAFAHSYVEDGQRVMYGQKGRGEPWWAGAARLVLGDITFEHAKAGPEHGKIADNIADRPEEYMDYARVLVGIFNNENFKFNISVTNSNPSLSIFDYVQKNGKTKGNNIFLLSSYVDLQTGTKSFSNTDKNKMNLLEGYLKQQGVNYTSSVTQTTETKRTAMNATRQVTVNHYNIQISE